VLKFVKLVALNAQNTLLIMFLAKNALKHVLNVQQFARNFQNQIFRESSILLNDLIKSELDEN
jgi:hypothetical protein